MEIILKKCCRQDLDSLREISIRTFSDAFKDKNNTNDFHNYVTRAFSKRQLLYELNTTDTSFYFAVGNDDFVGYFKVNVLDAQNEFREAKGMELERIYVKPLYQGQGIGSKMLSFVESLAQKEGKTYLWLGVWEHNPKAIRFYERHGYEKFGTHPYYIGSDKQTDWLLKKRFV